MSVPQYLLVATLSACFHILKLARLLLPVESSEGRSGPANRMASMHQMYCPCRQIHSVMVALTSFKKGVPRILTGGLP